MSERLPIESVATVRRESSRAVAPAALVNRTHRVIRERALNLQARRKTLRTLAIPLVVSAGFLVAIVFAIWSALDEFDLQAAGISADAPDATPHIFVLLMWCLPITFAVLAVILFRRNRSENEGAR